MMYARMGYDMTLAGAAIRKIGLTEADRSAWWYLFEFYGPITALEMAQKWGF